MLIAISGQWAHNYPDQPDRHSELESGYGKSRFANEGNNFIWY